jgi:hypothetical protein
VETHARIEAQKELAAVGDARAAGPRPVRSPAPIWLDAADTVDICDFF